MGTSGQKALIRKYKTLPTKDKDSWLNMAPTGRVGSGEGHDTWVGSKPTGRVGSGAGHDSWVGDVKKPKPTASSSASCGPSGMTQKPSDGSQSTATKMCIKAGCKGGSSGLKSGWKCRN